MPCSFARAALFAIAVLAGTVTDRTTGQPMPGVTIAVGALHTITQADGTFRLAGVAPGHATLTASSDDVAPQRFTVTIGPTATHRDLQVCSTTLDYNCGPPQ